MWFYEQAIADNPGRIELHLFVQNVRKFLYFVLDESEHDFDFLWDTAPDLRQLAIETFAYDIMQGAGLELDDAINNISNETLITHGLTGRPLHFKFRVLDSIANQYLAIQKKRDIRGRFKKQLSIREWLKKILDAIDAILDSLIDAAGGAGGLIKEFKDALASLA